MAEGRAMQVTLVYSPAPREVREWPLDVPANATVAMALKVSAIANEFPGIDWKTADLGVWGRKASLAQVLHEHDRIEVYRPLVVDPKVARRERFRKQGARAAGLFARKK
jgi:putative ubiquitin-RnfH superfamily antitoxin RatB of RatAB toxin-antitoxin module